MKQGTHKSYFIYWYSQSGNSWICANRVFETLKKRSANVSNVNVYIESMLSKTLYSDLDNSQDSNLLVLVFPVFNFNVPIVVKDFISRMYNSERQILPKKAIAIVTKGGMESNVPWILKKMLANYGVELIDYCSFAVEDSYIPLRKWFAFALKKGLPNEDTLQKVDEFVNKIITTGNSVFENNENNENNNEREKKKNIYFNPFSITHWIGQCSQKFGTKFMLGKRFWVKERCVECNLCIYACPVNAISKIKENKEKENKENKKEGKKESIKLIYDYDKCIGCCGCLNLCSKNAWEAKKFHYKYYYRPGHFKKFSSIIFNSLKRH